ncbi:hypothetical protein ELC62_31175, partial [Klebsiella pneumoniae]|nr:hypothetical protein [Klebsiella pneumoniae]
VISSETSQQEYLITSVADSVFNNKQIASVSIGSGITTINSQAFSYSNISTLDLSGATSLATIGANAFTGNALTSVT